jgi:hypothetical protein
MIAEEAPLSLGFCADLRGFGIVMDPRKQAKSRGVLERGWLFIPGDNLCSSVERADFSTALPTAGKLQFRVTTVWQVCGF